MEIYGLNSRFQEWFRTPRALTAASRGCWCCPPRAATVCEVDRAQKQRLGNAIRDSNLSDTETLATEFDLCADDFHS